MDSDAKPTSVDEGSASNTPAEVASSTGKVQSQICDCLHFFFYFVKSLFSFIATQFFFFSMKDNIEDVSFTSPEPSGASASAPTLSVSGKFGYFFVFFCFLPIFSTIYIYIFFALSCSFNHVESILKWWCGSYASNGL